MTPPSPQPCIQAPFDFQREMVALIPFLRAFACSLCHRRDLADDLAQETLVKAWRAKDRFEPGTNLKAWLFTILRNELFSRRRREWRQAHWDEDASERIAAPADAQVWSSELCDTAHAMRNLPADQREALVLVGAAGFSYGEAAEICGAPLGTIKSRVARARAALLDIVDGKKPFTRLAGVEERGGFNDVLAQLIAIVPARAPRAAHG
jgi:RNA polymerase sigma-70 factor (ECF subfamily)